MVLKVGKFRNSESVEKNRSKTVEKSTERTKGTEKQFFQKEKTVQARIKRNIRRLEGSNEKPSSRNQDNNSVNVGNINFADERSDWENVYENQAEIQPELKKVTKNLNNAVDRDHRNESGNLVVQNSCVVKKGLAGRLMRTVSSHGREVERCLKEKEDGSSKVTNNSDFERSEITTRRKLNLKTTDSTNRDNDVRSSVGIEKMSSEMSKLKNIINSYKTRLKATVDENVDLKNLNEYMKLQLEETTAELLDLKIEVKSLKIWKDVKTNHTVETFTGTKSGRRKYDMTTDMKYNAIVQKIREKFSSFFAMQVVELEEQVFDDFKDESDEKGTIVVPVRGWTGRAEIVNGGENAGTLVSIASNDEYVATCPLMTAMKHGMYAPSFSSFEEQISLFLS